MSKKILSPRQKSKTRSKKKALREDDETVEVPIFPLKINSAATPETDTKKKLKYPKSARHAKSNTGSMTKQKNKKKKESAQDDSVYTFSNIKPSISKTEKYQSNKRLRSRTQGNVLKQRSNENSNSRDADDEKRFFRSNSSRSGKKGKKSKKSSNDTTPATPSLEDEFNLPAFLTNDIDAIIHKQLQTFSVTKKYDIEMIEDTFKEFETNLRIRKEQCLNLVKDSFDKNKFIEIKIDVNGTNEMISQIGTLLGEKEFELDKEQALCIDKLREIIYFEDHSNDAKKQLKELQKTLAIEKSKMEQDQQRVKAELAKVEPQLRAAKQAVSGIPKSSLDEFRALRKPAPILVDVVRAVAILVGKDEKKLKTWNDVKRVLDSKFIDYLLNFDTKQATRKSMEIIEVKYLQRADFTYDRINQASTVAGPFVFWLESQIDYARLLDKVSPIQRAVDKLKNDLKMNELRAIKLEEMLKELSKKVKKSRGEMMEMVRKIVQLQDDIKQVREEHANSSVGVLSPNSVVMINDPSTPATDTDTPVSD